MFPPALTVVRSIWASPLKSSTAGGIRPKSVEPVGRPALPNITEDQGLVTENKTVFEFALAGQARLAITTHAGLPGVFSVMSP